MADFPTLYPTPLFVHTWSPWSAFDDIYGVIGSITFTASGTWPVASAAFYVPIWLPWPYLVSRVFWYNGSSVASVNVDFGIYNADGTLIYSTGSTARVGASAAQYVTPSTPFVLSPGQYYFGHSCDSTTASRGGFTSTTGTVGRLALAGYLQQGSALPLPATMTPVTVANVYHPLCGITRTASGF